MIVCPNCNHQNPDGAVQCEACYTPLPVLATCPSCHASVQSDASFCGQCGFDLRTVETAATLETDAGAEPEPEASESITVPEYELTVPDMSEAVAIPDLLPPEPLIETAPVVGLPKPAETANATPPASISAPMEANEPATATPPAPLPAAIANAAANLGSTQLQVNQAQLLHIQTNAAIELPNQLTIIHLGKPNDRIPPTIDVSGFPDSEIVSRVHASIRVEGDIYYIEDVGSSNGTYINNMPLPPGNRHRLRAGDRIALGKGDKVTFIFQSG
ncbi:MAG: FHA domain-containing protein [Leptolyngbya sp. SIOISBB]|nr:FHA domain-containing protein [Leptolyngbya sp. SIOISBB]